MFVFVNAARHGLETPCLLDLLHEGRVDGKITEGSRVLAAGGGCSAGEVVVVRWAEQEYAFARLYISRVDLSGGTRRTHSPSRRSCRPTQRQARSTSSRHACVYEPHRLLQYFMLIAHGAIMARACGVGIETSPCCEDAVPMGVVELGTSSSQSSSCWESCLPFAVYHEPACEALRVTIFCAGRR